MSEPTSYPRLCNPTDQSQLAPAGVPAACQPLTTAFKSATGWVLDFEESRSSFRRRKAERLPEAAAHGRLHITDLSAELPPGKPAASREHCDQLATAISALYHQLQQHRDELRLAHTQLALPGRIALAKDRGEKLQRLLTQLLQTACSQFGYESAGIMILDESTTMLVQRVGIGPHFSQANGIGRLLDQSRADIEALSGGVVVLNTRGEVASWQAPVTSRAAVCIPIASLDNLHGTLWLAGETKRELTDSDTNLLEIIAGRIAAELETATVIAQQSAVNPALLVAEAAAEEECVYPESLETLAIPFDGWELDCPQPPHRSRQTQSLTLSQVDPGENLQLLVACTRHPSGRDELRLARQAFAVLRGLELDATQMFHSIQHFLKAEAAFAPELRLACIKLDPLSGEFECQGDSEIRANLALSGQQDACAQSRRFGFLSHGNSLRIACTLCTSDLLVIRRK